VLATASHDGGPASIYHPSGSIVILNPPYASTPQGLIEPSRFARSKFPPCRPLQSVYRWKTAVEGNWPKNRGAEQHLGGEPQYLLRRAVLLTTERTFARPCYGMISESKDRVTIAATF